VLVVQEYVQLVHLAPPGFELTTQQAHHLFETAYLYVVLIQLGGGCRRPGDRRGRGGGGAGYLHKTAQPSVLDPPPHLLARDAEPPGGFVDGQDVDHTQCFQAAAAAGAGGVPAGPRG
jgi:hypothetical protein